MKKWMPEEPTTYSKRPWHEDLKNDFDFTLESSHFLKNFNKILADDGEGGIWTGIAKMRVSQANH